MSTKRASEDPPENNGVKRNSDNGDSGRPDGNLSGNPRITTRTVEKTGSEDEIICLGSPLLKPKSTKGIPEDRKSVGSKKFIKDLSEYDQYVEVERNGVVAVQRLPTEEDETEVMEESALFDALDDVAKEIDFEIEAIITTAPKDERATYFSNFEYLKLAAETVKAAIDTRNILLLKLMTHHTAFLVEQFHDWGTAASALVADSPTAGSFALLKYCHTLFTWPARVGEEDKFKIFFKLLREKYPKFDNFTNKEDILDPKFWKYNQMDNLRGIVVGKLATSGSNITIGDRYVVINEILTKAISLRMPRSPFKPCTSKSPEYNEYQLTVDNSGYFEITQIC